MYNIIESTLACKSDIKKNAIIISNKGTVLFLISHLVVGWFVLKIVKQITSTVVDRLQLD